MEAAPQGALASSASSAFDASKLATGAVVTLVGRVAGRGLHVATQVLLARGLGPTGFGLYALGWTLVRIAGLIVPVGLHHGVIKFGRPYWQVDAARLRSVVWRAIIAATCSGSLFVVIFWIAVPWLSRHAFSDAALAPVLQCFAPAIALYAGLRVGAAATRVSQRMHYGAILEDLLPAALNLVLVAVVLAAGLGVEGAALAGTASFGLALLAAFWWITRLLPRAPQRQTGVALKSLIRFSLPAALAGAMGLMAAWVDRLMVGLYLPSADVGTYYAVTQLAAIFGLIVNAFNAIMQPMIPDMLKLSDRRRLGELYRVSTKWGLYVSVPIFITFALLSGPVLRVVFGPEYDSGASALTVLTIAQLINVGTGGVGMLLIMTGFQRDWSWLSGISLVMNIGLNAAFIPHYGLLGAASATAISFTAMFVGGVLCVFYRLRLWPYDRRVLKGSAAGLLAAAAVVATRQTVQSEWLLVIFGGTLSAAAFVAGLLMLGLDVEDRAVAAVVRRRLAQAAGGAR